MATIKVPYRISELDIDNICYTDIKVNNKKTIVYMKYSDNNKLKNIVFQTPTFMSTNLIQVKNNMYELDVPLICKEENKVDKIKPNNGKEGALKTPTDKLFFVLFYLKCYLTFDVFGLFLIVS
jgi:hypothetical protein